MRFGNEQQRRDTFLSDLVTVRPKDWPGKLYRHCAKKETPPLKAEFDKQIAAKTANLELSIASTFNDLRVHSFGLLLMLLNDRAFSYWLLNNSQSMKAVFYEHTLALQAFLFVDIQVFSRVAHIEYLDLEFKFTTLFKWLDLFAVSFCDDIGLDYSNYSRDSVLLFLDGLKTANPSIIDLQAKAMRKFIGKLWWANITLASDEFFDPLI